MDTINIILPGNPVTKKNSQMIGRTAGGRPFIMSSKRFRQYEKEARAHINYEGEPIKTPVNVKVVYFMQTRRQVDLTNLLEATDDILVKCGVLADDNYKIVSGHDGSRVLFDKENPRAEITISETHWTQILWDLYGVEKTYTNEDEKVLDNCMGSGSTGIACLNTGRDFIGIEKDPEYFEIAKNRIEEHEKEILLKQS